VVGVDSQASVMYIASGKEYVLKGPADYVVKDMEVSGSAGMPPLTRETEWRTSSKVLVQVAQTSAASVRMRSIAKVKPDMAPKLLFPTRDSVSTLQPTFRWRAANPSAQSEFTLLVTEEEKPVYQAKVIGGTLQLPAKLKPETEYAWLVSLAGNEIGSARFRTLTAQAVSEIERRRPPTSAEFSDRLLFALLLYEMGATQEARESWAKLSQERSDLPELAGLAR